jgi:histidine triad (HIT) family protein
MRVVEGCIFCRIVKGEIKAYTVYEDERVIVFLDSGPIFEGHCLICPKEHVDNIHDLPRELMQPLLETAELIATAVEKGLGAEGSFMALNNTVSQSVPHFHLHLIPRRRGDGMKGFFWPRRPYRDEAHIAATQAALKEAISSTALLDPAPAS